METPESPDLQAPADLPLIEIIRDPETATAVLKPPRPAILAALREPDSASGLALRLGLARQRRWRVNRSAALKAAARGPQSQAGKRRESTAPAAGKRPRSRCRMNSQIDGASIVISP